MSLLFLEFLVYRLILGFAKKSVDKQEPLVASW
jgi:hypothetical protein